MIRTFGSVTGLTNQPQGLDIGISAGGSPIKSIQVVTNTILTANTTQTYPISPVDTSKSIILSLGVDAVGTGSPGVILATATLTNSTTVTLTRGSTGVASNFSLTVVEFASAKSKQTGSIADTANPMNVTVSSVNPSKCILYAMVRTPDTANDIRYSQFKYVLTSPTNIEFSNQMTSGTWEWQLIEFN